MQHQRHTFLRQSHAALTTRTAAAPAAAAAQLKPRRLIAARAGGMHYNEYLAAIEEFASDDEQLGLWEERLAARLIEPLTPDQQYCR